MCAVTPVLLCPIIWSRNRPKEWLKCGEVASTEHETQDFRGCHGVKTVATEKKQGIRQPILSALGPALRQNAQKSWPDFVL